MYTLLMVTRLAANIYAAACPFTMAQLADRIAKAVSRNTDSTFTDALTSRDRSALSAMIEEFFCSSPDEEDPDHGTQPT